MLSGAQISEMMQAVGSHPRPSDPGHSSWSEELTF